MALRVTKAITRNNHYYRVGDEYPSRDESHAGSLNRQFVWLELVDSGPKPAVKPASLAGLSKAELLDAAQRRGVEVPAKATKKPLVELLES